MTSVRVSSADPQLLVQLSAADPDTLVDAREIARLAGIQLRAAQSWLRRLAVPRANVPGVAHCYRVADVVAAIRGRD